MLLTIKNELYISKIKEFLGKEGLQYLKEYYDNGKFDLAFSSMLYGRVGMQIRNYLREGFPEIDESYKNEYGNELWYNHFEDDSYKITLYIIKNL